MDRKFFIKRRVDDFGRFSIPKIYIDVLGIEKGEKLYVFYDGNVVSIAKAEGITNYKDIFFTMKVDSNNRVSIPKQMRNLLGLFGESCLKLNLNNKNIQIAKFTDNKKCLVCGSIDDIKTNNGVAICINCFNNFR